MLAQQKNTSKTHGDTLRLKQKKNNTYTIIKL